MAEHTATASRQWYPSEFNAEEQHALGELLGRNLPLATLSMIISGKDPSKRPVPQLVADGAAGLTARIAYTFDTRMGFGALSQLDDEEAPACVATARARLCRALRAFEPWALFDLLRAFEPEDRSEPSERAARRYEDRRRKDIGPAYAEWLSYFRAREAAKRAVADANARSELVAARTLPSFRASAERPIAEVRAAAMEVIGSLDRLMELAAQQIFEKGDNFWALPKRWGDRRRSASHRREAVAVLHAGLSDLGFGHRDIAALVLESSTWACRPCPNYVADKSRADGDPKDRIAWEIGKDLQRSRTKRTARSR